MIRCAAGIPYKDGRILLGKRASDRKLYPNVWDVVGGHCQPGEEIDQAMIRELQEEVGITPVVFTKLGVLYETKPHIHGKREYHIYVVTQWVGSGPSILGEEHSEIRWFLVDEAIHLELAHPKYVDLFDKLKQ